MPKNRSNEERIPREVRGFLARYIRTVSHLELLLLIYETRDRSWTVEELSREMRTNDSLTSQQLKDIDGPVRRLEGESPSYRFALEDAPGETSQDVESPLGVVKRLAELYKTHRHAIIYEIYNPRESVIQGLADAFKISRDDS